MSIPTRLCGDVFFFLLQDETECMWMFMLLKNVRRTFVICLSLLTGFCLHYRHANSSEPIGRRIRYSAGSTFSAPENQEPGKMVEKMAVVGINLSCDWLRAVAPWLAAPWLQAFGVLESIRALYQKTEGLLHNIYIYVYIHL